MRLAWQPIPLEDFALPEATRDTFDSFNVQLAAFAQMLDLEVGKARTFYIPGKGKVPKDRLFEVFGPWPLEFKLYGGTLAEARRLGAKLGWDVCDGSGGAPDLRDKFIRGADGNAGGTGGADTHTHTSSSHDHTIDGAVTDAEANHQHTSAGSLGASDHNGTVEVCAGANFATELHSHIFTGGSSSAAGGHSHGFTGQTTAGACVTTDAGNNLPAYYEAIILRKREWTH